MIERHTLITTWPPDCPTAKNFIEGIETYWGDEICCAVFVQEKAIEAPGWWIRMPFSSHKGMNEYLSKLPWDFMRGRDPEISTEYREAFNAYMCFKCYLWMAVNEGKVFWVDSDIITHEPVTPAWLDELLPDNKLCCYLGRHANNMLPETGFVGFNTRHPGYQNYKEALLNFVDNGFNLSLNDWTDQGAFEVMRKCYNQEVFVDLGAGIKHNGHVFVNSILGSKMDQLKGPRKKHGNSLPSDLMMPRPEPYWEKVRNA